MSWELNTSPAVRRCDCVATGERLGLQYHLFFPIYQVASVTISGQGLTPQRSYFNVDKKLIFYRCLKY